KNWSRIIPDAGYSPAPIIPSVNPGDGRPLDLSHSVIRSVSPLHRQYLANMGVVASMSLSLILRGQLWGLIACHHRSPHHLSQRLRAACELFAEVISSKLEMKVAEEEFSARMRSTAIHQELVARLSHEQDLAEGLIRYRPNLLDFIPAIGVGLWIDGRLTTFGKAPGCEEVEALVAWLNATAQDGVFHTDCLARLYPPAEGFADVASGILALSVSKTPRDYVLWFRPELIQTVTWAGNPNKSLETAADGETLTPRASFAAWTQMVRLHCAAWLDSEVDAAYRLRVSLLEVVLHRIDLIAREREAARLQQAELTCELDRRLAEWQSAAQALEVESRRRSVVEGELSEILHRTVEDQEAERLRIARELHDRLGQSLTLLQLGLDGLGRETTSTGGIQQQVVALKNIATKVGQEVNRLAWEIRPTELDDLGLQTAIQNLVETWSESSRLRFDLHLKLDGQRLSPAIETTLYRVVQEALTNVVRHAAATRVGIILRIVDMTANMIIEDNGRGFDCDNGVPTPDTPRRMGLLGMRERLSSIGGTLEIESSPGQGTTLFVLTPI
ncbi:MAG TPA: GAF domain-containing protein, partial [Rhodospirillaceae bacterium]|nr:GAF domain-containing protein [Rhodospirillaceae bacterium]